MKCDAEMDPPEVTGGVFMSCIVVIRPARRGLIQYVPSVLVTLYASRIRASPVSIHKVNCGMDVLPWPLGESKPNKHTCKKL